MSFIYTINVIELYNINIHGIFLFVCRNRLWFAGFGTKLIKLLSVDKIRKDCVSFDCEMEQA